MGIVIEASANLYLVGKAPKKLTDPAAFVLAPQKRAPSTSDIAFSSAVFMHFTYHCLIVISLSHNPSVAYFSDDKKVCISFCAEFL
jgi:hypothetical protein